MATFFGTIQGERGQATRLGHGHIKATAQSYEGSVVVELFKANDGALHCQIAVGAGSKQHGDFLLYNGPITALFDDATILRG